MSWIELILKYLPVVLQVVMAIQKALPMSTPVAVKKSVAMETLAMAHPDMTAEDQAGVSKMVDQQVDILKANEVGGFTKSKS